MHSLKRMRWILSRKLEIRDDYLIGKKRGLNFLKIPIEFGFLGISKKEYNQIY